jgi:hypothetical protein
MGAEFSGSKPVAVSGGGGGGGVTDDSWLTPVVYYQNCYRTEHDLEPHE